MRRREFIAGLGGAAAWPMVAGAQQTALPVIGFLHSSAFTEARRGMLAAFRQGLAEWGYIVDGNVAVEYHWAEDQYDRLPALAVDLVRRNVAVIITMVNSQAALAAKAATQTVPIVFVIGADPVRVRLVAGLARPGGNVTGLTVLSNEVVSKRLELLRQLVPTATAIAFLYNPTNIANEAEEVQDAARALGVRVVMMNASDRNGIEAAFRVLVERQAGALLVSADPLFGYSTMNTTIVLAARHAIPTMFVVREAVEAGGFMSYGTSIPDMYRRVGVYAGRILRGEKPADLPVMQPTKFELVINLRTAKALDLAIPETLLATADEVLE